MNKPSNIQSTRFGVTLVELLVVISILAVVSAYLIPKVRVISADRDIRETARIVGSVFNSAAQRAIAEDGAGVVIVTNPNLVDNTEGGSVFYGGTALYQMRSRAPYTGDAAGTQATTPAAADTLPVGFTRNYVVNIPLPFEHENQSRPFIKPDDYIRVNNSSLNYRINATHIDTTNGLLQLSLDHENFAKPQVPDGTAGYPFVIKRQPKILRSTRVDLPAGYMIDMRYSGPTRVFETPSSSFPAGRITNAHNVTNYSGAAVEETGTVFNQELTNTIVVLFRPDGGIDRIQIQPQGGVFGSTSAGTVNPVHDLAHNGRLTGALHLLIAENDPNPVNLTVQRQESLWVTVGNDSGTVNVGVNNATDGGDPTIIDGFLLNVYPQTTLNRASVLHARQDAGSYGALQ